MTEPNLDKEIADYIQKWGDWTGVENYDLQIADLKSLISNQVAKARIEAFDVAFDCHDYDKLRAYRAKLLKEVK